MKFSPHKRIIIIYWYVDNCFQIVAYHPPKGIYQLSETASETMFKKYKDKTIAQSRDDKKSYSLKKLNTAN